ncbi:MAG: hypothetical protein SVT56_12540, partial [Chloroflexota bacterium]|nr:hypothetical protein [Chloroflexota bacterium]
NLQQILITLFFVQQILYWKSHHTFYYIRCSLISPYYQYERYGLSVFTGLNVSSVYDEEGAFLVFEVAARPGR